MYKIRGIDGKEYGPVSVEILRQWLQERRLTLQSLVQPAGSAEWQPISALPELVSALSGSQPATAIAAQTALPAAAPRTSGLAIGSLVAGICAANSCGLGALVGIVLGIIAL